MRESSVNSTVNVCIVGGGAAGLFLAANLPASVRTIIVEKTSNLGKKLLLTGGGRCNFSHRGSAEELLQHYHGAGRRLLRPALRAMSSGKLLDLFSEMGLASEVDADGRVFPLSERASDVLTTLRRQIELSGHEILRESRVNSVSRLPQGLFKTRYGSSEIVSRFVVMATGGCSYPATGSSGDGYALARKLGHTIIRPEPALTDLRITDFVLSGLAGVSLRHAGLVLKRKGETIARKIGELLITHHGLSGPAVLNLSGYAQPGDCLNASFTVISEEELKRCLINASCENGSRHLITVLSQLEVPRSLLLRLCDLAKIDHTKHISQLTREERRKIALLLCNMEFVIKGKGGFDSAMVTRGGVNLGEVNPKTMESKLVKGLYFCGEILDIDGETGGYNLHAAFATAYLAARHITRS